MVTKTFIRKISLIFLSMKCHFLLQRFTLKRIQQRKLYASESCLTGATEQTLTIHQLQALQENYCFSFNFKSLSAKPHVFVS